MGNLEDKLVTLIEPILEKYKKSLKDNPKIDFRNFAAHDIAEVVIKHIATVAQSSGVDK